MAAVISGCELLLGWLVTNRLWEKKRVILNNNFEWFGQHCQPKHSFGQSWIYWQIWLLVAPYDNQYSRDGWWWRRRKYEDKKCTKQQISSWKNVYLPLHSCSVVLRLGRKPCLAKSPPPTPPPLLYSQFGCEPISPILPLLLLLLPRIDQTELPQGLNRVKDVTKRQFPELKAWFLHNRMSDCQPKIIFCQKKLFNFYWAWGIHDDIGESVALSSY